MKRTIPGETIKLNIVFVVTLALLVLTSSLILLVYWRPPEAPEKQKRMVIEPISTERAPEPPSTDLMPQKLPWMLEKGTAGTDSFYAGGVPRKPEIALKVNISASISGKLAEALVEGDKVFLADSQGVYALNKDDGNFVWGVEVYSDDLAHRAMQGPNTTIKWKALGLWRFVKTYGIGKYLYVATSSYLDLGDAYLLAIDKDNGELIWKVRLESEEGASSKSSVTSNLLVIDGKVFVGSVGPEGYVFAVSEGGELLWREKIGGNVRGLTYGEGMLFATSEYRKKLYAFNPVSGRPLWIYEHDAELMTPSYGGGRVVTVDSLGRILAISTNGELLWKKHLGIGGDVDTNSYIALSSNYIYSVRSLGERPRNLYVLDFDGGIVGNFTLGVDEDGGRPASSRDLVVLPVLKKGGESKVYLLWRGFHKLSEYHFSECGSSGWMPKVSIAYGEILVVACPSTLYRLTDVVKPTIDNIEISYNETLIIKVKAYDEQSALHKVLLVYSTNNSPWNYKEMDIARRYLMEPIGGYGLREELYITEVSIEVGRVEFYVIAIDNVGNYQVTNVYGYRAFYLET